jgi:pseudouridine synthase
MLAATSPLARCCSVRAASFASRAFISDTRDEFETWKIGSGYLQKHKEFFVKTCPQFIQAPLQLKRSVPCFRSISTSIADVRTEYQRYLEETKEDSAKGGVQNGSSLENGYRKSTNVAKESLPSLLSAPPSRVSHTVPMTKTRVWAVHKLRGELVSENDPNGRPCLMERLKRGGVGKLRGPTPGQQNNKGGHSSPLPDSQDHLKPVGRLDMNTEGLILVTTNGKFAHDMMIPDNLVHRSYRVRVHGILDMKKIIRMERGNIEIDNIRYSPMRVDVDAGDGNPTKRDAQRRLRGTPRPRDSLGTNKWVTVTCTEGKNRMIRKVFEYLGCKFAPILIPPIRPA